MGIPAVRMVPLADQPEVQVPFRDYTKQGGIELVGVWRGDRLDPEQGDGVFVVVDFAVEERVVPGTEQYEPTGFTGMVVQRIDPVTGEPLSQPTVVTFKDATEDPERSATGGVGIDAKPLVGMTLQPVSPRRP